MTQEPKLRDLVAADLPACEELLRSLPAWFGIESSLREYVRSLPSCTIHVAEGMAGMDGFLAVRSLNARSAELHVVAVRQELHGQGVGTALLARAEAALRSAGTEYLQVKTLGPSRPDPGYDRTREFYLNRGFVPLEELNLWGPTNPCLILVKPLSPGAPLESPPVTVPVTTTFLEMTDPSEQRASQRPRTPFTLVHAAVPSPELSRFLYSAVGARCHWRARLRWSYDEWLRHLDRPEVQTWLALVDGTPGGYVELERQAEGNVEILYFGLLPGFIGRGFGGAFLDAAIAKAWAMDARRVWVHTCTLDHPAALPNYLARGFRVYKTTEHQETVPLRPGQPWPGAGVEWSES